MKAVSRPVYLDLRRMRLPLPGWVSILHRISGVLLFLAFPASVWGLSISLASEAGFQALASLLQHPYAKILLVALAWAFTHHFFSGLRHLALDAHRGVGLRQARMTGVAVVAASGAITLAFAGCLFA
ncbi:MAG: succinate dehydrogenase, cytochrome b556 subunit [Pseudomonadota bacterium]